MVKNLSCDDLRQLHYIIFGTHEHINVVSLFGQFLPEFS